MAQSHPYDSKWNARATLLMEAVFLVFSFTLFALGIVFGVFTLGALTWLAFMMLVFSASLCHTLFIFHVFRKSNELWLYFDCPIVDFHQLDVKRGIRFLFYTPTNDVFYPLSLRLHHNLCRVLYLLLLIFIIVGIAIALFI